MSDCRKSGRLKQCYPRTGRGDGDTLIRSLVFWTARHRHSLSSNTRALYTHAHIIEDSEILLRSQVVSPPTTSDMHVSCMTWRVLGRVKDARSAPKTRSNTNLLFQLPGIRGCTRG